MKKVKYIIIHSIAKHLNIDGVLMPAKEFLESIRLSAHFFIDSAGEVQRMIDWKHMALHAGVSKWKQDTNLNSCSIGIELMIDEVSNYAEWKEAIAKPETFTYEHYRACSELCASLCFEFDLSPDDAILIHSDVSGDDVRGEGKGKIDVGEGFDIVRLINMTKAELLHYPPLI